MLRGRLLCHASAFPHLRNARNNLLPNGALVAASVPARGLSTVTRHVSPSVLRLPSCAGRGRPWEMVTAVRCFASPTTKRSKKRKGGSAGTSPAPHVPAYVDTLVQLRDALADGDVKSVIGAYLAIRETLRLGGEDVGAMAQVVHTALRRHRPASKNDQPPPELLALADLLVADIGAHRLPPNHGAHLHLLAFYKELGQLDKGIDFWKWLESQDDSYVSPAVYGAAIELLAVQGRPAEETENLYEQALKRFPGAFNEYHLSPTAVLQDRSQPFNVKGLPVTLLQGIMTARLLRGDVKRAYLALDTALRLFPTQLPSRFFTLFVEERPVNEAYKVFLMACRSGHTLGPDCLKALLTKLRHVAVTDPLANATVLRALLTASYAYAATGASLSSSHLTEVVIAVTSVLQHPGPRRLSKDDLHELSDRVLLVVSKLFAIWTAQGARPGIAAFNSIIANLAGKSQRKDIIATCLEDMQTLDIQPTAVTRRSVLQAAGDIADRELLELAWADLVDLRQSTGKVVDLGDWQVLAKAARKVGAGDFVRQQLQQFAHVLNPALVARITGLVDERVREAVRGGRNVSAEQVKQLIDNLLRDITCMEDQLQADRFRNFHVDPLPMSLTISSIFDNADEQELRTLYDELTADTSFEQTMSSPSEDQTNTAENGEDSTDTDSPPAAQQPAMSTTGFDYAELRYQNWKTMNELLAESDRHDSEYIAAVEAAIQQGLPPPKKDSGWKTPELVGPSVGLSDWVLSKDAYQKNLAGANSSTDHGGSLRETILRLRGTSNES